MIDRDIQARADAFRGNQPQLLQRFKQSNDLLDLLALQKLKSEKEAAMQSMQMQQAEMQQKQGGLPTIAQQREQQVMDLTKNELLQQQRGVLAKKQADQQNAIRRLVSSGVGSVPAPNMARMMGGGIVGYQEGGDVDAEEVRRREIMEALRRNREASERYTPDSGVTAVPNPDAEDQVFTMEEMGYQQGGPVEFTPYKAPQELDPYLLRRYREMEEEAIDEGIAAFLAEDADGNTFLERPAPTPPRTVGERLAEVDLTEGMPPPRDVDTGDTFSQDYVAYLDTLTPKQRAEQEAADRLARRQEAETNAGIAAFDDGDTSGDGYSQAARYYAEAVAPIEATIARIDEALSKVGNVGGATEELRLLKSSLQDQMVTLAGSGTARARDERIAAANAELYAMFPDLFPELGPQEAAEEQEQVEGEPSSPAQDESDLALGAETDSLEDAAPTPAEPEDLGQFTVESIDEEDTRNPITRAISTLPQDKLDQLISFLSSAGTGTSVASALRTGAVGAQATKAEQAAIERALSEAAAERAQQRELAELTQDANDKQFLYQMLSTAMANAAQQNLNVADSEIRATEIRDRATENFTFNNDAYNEALNKGRVDEAAELLRRFQAPYQKAIEDIKASRVDFITAMQQIRSLYQ